MSSGGQTQTTFQGPPQWIQDAAQGYLNRAGEVAGQDYQPYTGQRVADLSPTTQAGIRGIDGLAHGHPMGDDAVNMTRQTLQGNYSNPYGGMQGGANVSTQRNMYAGENPYFQQQLARGQQKITDAYNRGVSADTTRMFNLSGAFGGSAHQNAIRNNQEVLGEQLGDFTNNMLADQYNRSAGLEESFLGRDFAGQQFNSGMDERAIDRGFQGHENERNRQMQGVGAATGLLGSHRDSLMAALQAGDIERRQMQSLLDSQYGDFQEWRNYPNQQLDIMGNAISRAMGGAGSQTTMTGPGPDRVSQGMGALALGSMFSRPGGGGK